MGFKGWQLLILVAALVFAAFMFGVRSGSSLTIERLRREGRLVRPTTGR